MVLNITARPSLVALVAIVAVGCLGSLDAHAQRSSTADALDRLDDVLERAVEDGALKGMVPMILVGAQPAYEDTRNWFPTAAARALADVIGNTNLRACEACLQPRVQAEGGALVYSSGALSVAEIVTLDQDTRGNAPPARSAATIHETPTGVAVRIIDLKNGAVLFAQNVDDAFTERKNTAKGFTYAADVERRLRGESLTHIWFDLALYPGQHISLDVVDQFGDKNLDVAGVTFSFLDPVLGVGAAYYRVIPEAFNLTVGAQAVVSIPTAATTALDAGDLIDPLITGVLVVRWPIFDTSYGIVGTASTNGVVGIGVSLLNIDFLPVLP